MRPDRAVGAWPALLACTLLAFQSAPAQSPGGAEREIIHVTGELYRARQGNWYTIFLVTPAGIVLGDPISTGFSTWLREQLDERFDVPVRYVVYSHSHFDHAEGGAVFADTAVFIAHENMARNMDGRYPHMPGDMIDRGNTGVINPEDIDIPTDGAPGICGMGPGFFERYDRNGDGVITPAELQAQIHPPDLFYSDRMTLRLGGSTVELIFPGLNHSDDATVMHFPDERVVFATEFLADALVTDNIRSLPSACGPFDYHPLSEWIRSYRTVEALDFDILAPGHGALADRAAVTETREYFEYLVAEVSAGMQAGKSLEELKDSVLLERYSHWDNYERLRRRNVEAAYLNLKYYR